MKSIGYTDAHLILTPCVDAYSEERVRVGLDSDAVRRFFANVRDRGLLPLKFRCVLSGQPVEVMTLANGDSVLAGGQS